MDATKLQTESADCNEFCNSSHHAMPTAIASFRHFPAIFVRGTDNAFSPAIVGSQGFVLYDVLTSQLRLTMTVQAVLLALGKRYYKLIHDAVDVGLMALSFRVYGPGLSARADWDLMKMLHPHEMGRILRHLVAVDNGGLPQHNAILAKAMKIPQNPGHDLYWWNIGVVGAFYQRYDAQTVVVDATLATTLPPYYTAHALRRAEGRL